MRYSSLRVSDNSSRQGVRWQAEFRCADDDKVIKVIIGTLITLGDHLDRLAKSARGQKFSLIQSAKLAILYRWN
jgi:hypothetical protein